jgi:hypothetical protein
MMGANPPGPLEWVETHVVELASGQAVAHTRSLVPLDGCPPPEVMRWP